MMQAELPWPLEPVARPRCFRCQRPALADKYHPESVWCSGCGSVEPRLTPKREAELRAEVRPPRPGRRVRGPSTGGTAL